MYIITKQTSKLVLQKFYSKLKKIVFLHVFLIFLEETRMEF